MKRTGGASPPVPSVSMSGMTDERLVSRTKRTRWYRSVAERSGGPLPAQRAAARLSAYVYGNIMALASIAIVSSEDIEDGRAVAVVAGTGFMTFVAHIFSDLVAHSAATTGDAGRAHILEEFRDALPIASSALVPSVILALGWFGVLPPHGALLGTGGVIVARIASVQIVTERVRGNPLSFRVVVAGLITAAVAAGIVFLKIAVGH